MTIPADGRGGSTPPRPAAPDSKPGQWFVFGPWVYDVDAAAGRDVLHPTQHSASAGDICLAWSAGSA